MGNAYRCYEFYWNQVKSVANYQKKKKLLILMLDSWYAVYFRES